MFKPTTFFSTFSYTTVQITVPVGYAHLRFFEFNDKLEKLPRGNFHHTSYLYITLIQSSLNSNLFLLGIHLLDLFLLKICICRLNFVKKKCNAVLQTSQ